MTTRRRQLVAALAALGFLLTACGSAADDDGSPVTSEQTDTGEQVAQPEATSAPVEQSETTSGATTATDAEATTPAADVAVPEALQFSAPLVGGGEFVGADFVDKPTVFWFWAPT